MNYYIVFNGQQVGPMSKEQLFAYPVDFNTQVFKEGCDDWRPLSSYPELMQELMNRSGNVPPSPSTDSKRLVCGILSIVIGALGIQYFIIGKTTAGILTIVLSLATCGLWEIITFIQGILILLMSDNEFERKYVTTPKTFPIF